MNHIPLIIKREYLAKVRKKSFIIMTILSPFILAAIPLLIGYLTSLDEDTIKSIYVLDESSGSHDNFLLSGIHEPKSNDNQQILFRHHHQAFF